MTDHPRYADPFPDGDDTTWWAPVIESETKTTTEVVIEGAVLLVGALALGVAYGARIALDDLRHRWGRR